MNQYWAQFRDEIDEMHGVCQEIEEQEYDIDFCDEEEEEYNEYTCCGGRGCNYCLMVGY